MSKRYSVRRGDVVEYSLWLAFSMAGDVRLSRGEPSLAAGWRAMQMTVKLPLALFRTSVLRAEVSVPADSDGDYKLVVEAAGEQLKKALGLDIDLRVEELNNDR